MPVLLEPPLRRWACPSCTDTAVSREPNRPDAIVSKLHLCRGQKGLLVPYVEVIGAELRRNSVVHRVIEREDYEGTEAGLRADGEGRVVMAVRTEREDGYDTHVFPGVARVAAEELR